MDATRQVILDHGHGAYSTTDTGIGQVLRAAVGVWSRGWTLFVSTSGLGGAHGPLIWK